MLEKKQSIATRESKEGMEPKQGMFPGIRVINPSSAGEYYNK